MIFQPGTNNYSTAGLSPENVEVPHYDTRAPVSSDINYPVGKRWVYIGNGEYSLLSLSSIGGTVTANWALLGTDTGALNTLTGDSGGAISPSAGNINILGNTLQKFVGSGSTLTLTEQSGAFPITPYVVGPLGQAGYQTVQSAINAAHAAGGGQVWVQPGTYTENLTLYGDTSITGAAGNSDAGTSGNCAIITGVHTPPTTGSVCFANLLLTSATDIFNSSASGSAQIWITNVAINCTDGYTFNVPNWTGELIVYNLGELSTTNGVVNNTGGSTCFFISATMGAGTSKSMTTSGTVIMEEIELKCPWNAATGTVFDVDVCIFSGTVTAANDSSGQISSSRFSTGATPALTMSSSGNLSLTTSIIDSSNNPSISGSGAGTLTMGDLTFLQNSTIAGTLTTAWSPSKLGASTVTGALTQVGTTNINATGSAVTTIGTGGTGAVNIGNATGNTSITGSLSTTTSLSATTTVTGGTGLIATTGNVTMSASGAGISGVVSTGSGAASGSVTCNGRLGSVTFTSPSIAGGATSTLTVSNSSVAGASTVVLYGVRGATTGAALNVQSVTNSAGSSAVVISNGTGATTQTGSIILDFIVLN